MVPDTTHSRALAVRRAMLRGVIVGGLVAAGIHFGYILLGSNLRTVIPGKLYRCAQPSGRALAAIIKKHRIRTVVNLRNSCVTSDWYRDEARATSEADVSQEDLSFSAGRLPATTAIRQLIEVFDRARYPILVHCQQGADRTGLAIAVFFLLQHGVPYASARRQLGLASGHIPLGRTQYIDRFFDLYEDWLKVQAQDHSPARFRDWACNYYCPAGGKAEFTLVDPPHLPGSTLHLTSGRARVLTVRCRNTSIRTWQMEAGTNAGIQLRWFLVDDNERCLATSSSGLFERRVPAGDHVDLAVPLPALAPGRYQLRVDLFDAQQQGSFFQLGNPPLIVDVEVS